MSQASFEGPSSVEPRVEDWVTAWRGPLVALLRARGLDPGAATELTQDVFAEAWLSRRRYRGSWDDERAVGRWLGGIARNLHRAALRRPRPAPLATDPVDERAGPHEAEAVRVRAAIDRLPRIEREIVRMFYLEETSTRRVAALLDLSERAVEGRLRRARERLADWLASHADSVRSA